MRSGSFRADLVGVDRGPRSHVMRSRPLNPVLRSSRAVCRLFFRGCLPPLPTARTLTLWTVTNGSGLLRAKRSSLSRIASLSGPIWDRAHRVTQACRLKRVAACHDRRIGRIGDWTDHLCPCPSKLRWALPEGREGFNAKGGRTDRWPQRTAIPSWTILLELMMLSDENSLMECRESPAVGIDLLRAMGLLPDSGLGSRTRCQSSAPACREAPRLRSTALLGQPREASRGCRGRQ